MVETPKKFPIEDEQMVRSVNMITLIDTLKVNTIIMEHLLTIVKNNILVTGYVFRLAASWIRKFRLKAAIHGQSWDGKQVQIY